MNMSRMHFFILVNLRGQENKTMSGSSSLKKNFIENLFLIEEDKNFQT